MLVIGVIGYASYVLKCCSDVVYVPSLHCNQSSIECVFSNVRGMHKDRTYFYGGGILQHNLLHMFKNNRKSQGNSCYPLVETTGPNVNNVTSFMKIQQLKIDSLFDEPHLIVHHIHPTKIVPKDCTVTSTQLYSKEQKLDFIKLMCVSESDIIGDEKYVQLYYPLDDWIRNKGKLNFIDPKYVG